jgi:nucleoside 2-deoxyribosyltransferase
MLVFLGGPLRSAEHRAQLEDLERVIEELGFDVWVPHKKIGIVPAGSADVSALERNFEALGKCNIAVFILDSERTGTGVELGFLYSLIAAGKSSSRIIGFLHSEASSLDLMAKLCISRHGILARGTTELRMVLSRFSEFENGSLPFLTNKVQQLG